MKFAILSALFAVAIISEGQALQLGQNAKIRDQLRQRLQIQGSYPDYDGRSYDDDYGARPAIAPRISNAAQPRRSPAAQPMISNDAQPAVMPSAVVLPTVGVTQPRVPIGTLSLPIYENVNNAITQTNLADSSLIAANGNLTQANTLIAQSDSQLQNGWGQVGSADIALDTGLVSQKLIAPSITGAQTSLSQAQQSISPIPGQVSDESADLATQLASVNAASTQAVALDDRCDPNDAQYSANQAECTQANINQSNNNVISSTNSAAQALGKYI